MPLVVTFSSPAFLNRRWRASGWHTGNRTPSSKSLAVGFSTIAASEAAHHLHLSGIVPHVASDDAARFGGPSHLSDSGRLIRNRS